MPEVAAAHGARILAAPPDWLGDRGSSSRLAAIRPGGVEAVPAGLERA